VAAAASVIIPGNPHSTGARVFGTSIMFDHTKSFAISADNLRSPLRFPRPYPAIGAVERNPTVKELAAVYKLLIPAREVT
jgi:hypothetical protein